MRVHETLAIALIAAAVCACSKGSSGGVDAGSSGSAIVPGPDTVQGVCQSTCPKTCNVDDDCATQLGELCCDYGSSKVCQAAQQCPVFCASNSVCQESLGQACVVTSLAPVAQSMCDDAGAGLQFCHADGDCTATQTCCTNYDRPICTDRSECPTPCTEDSQCNTLHGETCCTTVQAVEPNLTPSGLCLNPSVQACPRTCSSSSDCAALTAMPLCCNGLCAATCPTTCTQDSDCFQQICCKSPTVTAPLPPVLFTAAPPCAGATVTTCADCFQDLRTCTCLGCALTSDAGSCSGEGAVTSCAECDTSYGCEPYYCPGCSQALAPTCGGVPTYVSCLVCPTGTCEQDSGVGCPGCTWTGTQCIGDTPSACGANATQAECQSESGCYWGVPTCVGTVTACSSITTEMACNSASGCQWNTGIPSDCVGTPTACAQLATVPGDAGFVQCGLQPGCFVDVPNPPVDVVTSEPRGRIGPARLR